MTTAIAIYEPFRAQLGHLKKLNDETMFDYDNPAGNKDARSHVYKLRQTKSAVDEARKKEKAESLDYGRRVDGEAKEIAAVIDLMIEVHAKPLAEIEQREKCRISTHKENLAEIEAAGDHAVVNWQHHPLESMKDRLAEIEAESIGEDVWEEFALLAAQAKDAAVTLMREAIAKREAHDAEQAELAKLRQDKAAREQAEREESVRQEASQRATDEAEQKAAAEATLVREMAERRELELKLAAETSERHKAEAEQRVANVEKQVREEAEMAAKVAAEEAKARTPNKKRKAAALRESVAALVGGGLTAHSANLAVMLIERKSVPHVSISY